MTLPIKQLTISEMLTTVAAFVRADRPVMIHGSPGTGKTETLEIELPKLVGHPTLTTVLNTLESVDLRGLPKHGQGDSVVWSKPDFLAELESLVAAHGRVTWFIDEINSVGKSVEAPLMQLVRARRVGPHKLPDGVRIVAAGNYLTDGGVAQAQSTPLKNRFGHLYMANPATPDGVRDWCRWAAANDIHPALIAFIMLRGVPTGAPGTPGYRPSMLYHFDPKDRTADAFPTLRSVADVSPFVTEPAAVRFAAAQAQCGPTWAAEFQGFMQIYGTIPPLPAILANPNGAAVPDAPSSKYAVAMALAGVATPSNFDSVLTYMARVGREFQHATVTDALRRNPDVSDSSAYIRWAALNSDFTL